MITLELEPQLEHYLQNTALMLGITESELISKSLSEYLNKLTKSSPWELGKNDFGKYSSGQGNLSTDRKQLLKAKIQAKRQ